MSLESPITETHNWHSYERKILRWQVTEADGVTPVDLSTVAPGALEWKLRMFKGSSNVYMSKDNSASGGITVEDATASVTIEPDAPVSDYEGVPSGTHYYELWDRESDVLIAYGSAVLLPGGKPD